MYVYVIVKLHSFNFPYLPYIALMSVRDQVMHDLNRIGMYKIGLVICVLVGIVGIVVWAATDIEYVGPVFLGVGVIGGLLFAVLWVWKSQDIDERLLGFNTEYREEYKKIKHPYDQGWEYRRV